jgi:hypothetical protein
VIRFYNCPEFLAERLYTEAAARTFSTLAALLHLRVEKLRKETLHGSTHERFSMNCLRQEASVTTNDERVIFSRNLRHCSEIGEEANCDWHPQLEWAVGTRPFQCEVPADFFHELVDLSSGHLLVERLQQMRDEWNVGARQKRLCPRLQSI